MSQAFALANPKALSKMHSASNPNRIAVFADIFGPSKTRQEFSDECDINQIMARAEASGVFPFKDPAPPVFIDFVGMPDLQDAMAAMFDAEAAFMSLPALVRKEFDNDPIRFVEFASDGSNLPRLRELGLAEPEKVKEPPMEVRIVPEAGSPPTAPAGAPAKA